MYASPLIHIIKKQATKTTTETDQSYQEHQQEQKNLLERTIFDLDITYTK